MPFRKHPTYVRKARNGYQLQRGVPKDVQPVIGKTVWVEGAGSTYRVAQRLSPAFAAKTDRLIAEVQQVRRDSDLVDSSASRSVIDVSVATNTQKLQQFVSLAKTIDWPAIQECRESKEILASMPDILGLISTDFSR